MRIFGGRFLNRLTAGERAIARLRALGAIVVDATDQDRGRRFSIVLAGPPRMSKLKALLRRQKLVESGLSRPWSGTDLGLVGTVAALGKIRQLTVDFRHVSPVVLSAIKVARPIDFLHLEHVTDQAIDELTGLPACQNLLVDHTALAPASYRRLTVLVGGVSTIGLTVATSEMQSAPAWRRSIHNELAAGRA
ncbi:MAG TPA: hypothetical protein VGH74_00490 [Planctomycetaceae bacterium]|jgi:hypothetical protein